MKETLYLKKTYKKVRFAFFSAIRLHALTAGRKSNHPSSNIQQSSCHSWRYSAMPLFKRQTCQISRSFIEMV